MPAKKKPDTDAWKDLSDAIKEDRIGTFYILHGDERYLLERGLSALRKSLCPDGLSSFNYRRFEEKIIEPEELSNAVNTLPAFASRTLIEIHDFDLFKDEQKQQLTAIFADLPEHVCVLLIYDTVEYKPDGRQTLDKKILSCATVLNFTVQTKDELVVWINRHVNAAGKTISRQDAAYLVMITGGYMTVLSGEIGKAAAYATGGTITRSDINAVVTPVPDAAVYQLTDALMQRDHKTSTRILDELIRMREAPQRLIYSISIKMRQLLYARLCVEEKLGKKALIDMCGIRYDFQADILMRTARRMTLSGCCDLVLECSEAALDLNSAPEPEARLTELLTRMAFLI